MGQYQDAVVLGSRAELAGACPDLAQDCMEQIAPGVSGHVRSGLLFVFLDEANTPSGVEILHDEIGRRGEQRRRARMLAVDEARVRAR